MSRQGVEAMDNWSRGWDMSHSLRGRGGGRGVVWLRLCVFRGYCVLRCWGVVRITRVTKFIVESAFGRETVAHDFRGLVGYDSNDGGRGRCVEFIYSGSQERQNMFI